MSVLLDLAERCEAATGPDRNLDARIHCALQGIDYPYGVAFSVIEGSDWEPASRHVTRIGILQQMFADASKNWTGSLDAAMSLVPEGFRMELEQHSTCWTATLADTPWFDDRRRIRDADAKAPALALTAAALRARAAIDNPE